MRIQSFEYMQEDYSGGRGLDLSDLEERKNLLYKYNYSVIIEGGWMEYNNLYKWLKKNMREDTFEEIYYGKTGYDYGYVEFFFLEAILEEKMRIVVPSIYTTYPSSCQPEKVCKSDGYDNEIEYSPIDKNAIVYPAVEKV